jgi:hypothetical protein
VLQAAVLQAAVRQALQAAVPEALPQQAAALEAWQQPAQLAGGAAQGLLPAGIRLPVRPKTVVST